MVIHAIDAHAVALRVVQSLAVRQSCVTGCPRDPPNKSECRHNLRPGERGAKFWKRFLRSFELVTAMMESAVLPVDFMIVEYDAGAFDLAEALASDAPQPLRVRFSEATLWVGQKRRGQFMAACTTYWDALVAHSAAERRRLVRRSTAIDDTMEAFAGELMQPPDIGPSTRCREGACLPHMQAFTPGSAHTLAGTAAPPAPPSYDVKARPFWLCPPRLGGERSC